MSTGRRDAGAGAVGHDVGRQARGGGADASAPEEGQEGGRLRHLWEQFGTLVLAVVIALSIRSCVIEPFRIPSESMLPTLLVGDHLFVNKFVYGVRIPFTDVRLPGLRDPRRGDVVVFQVARSRGGIFPADRRPDLPRDDFVKRVVGVPGDEIEVRDGEVLINGAPLVQESAGAVFEDEDGARLLVREEQLGACLHSILDDPRSRGLTKGPFVIEEGRYFMMGDNRDHSNDSRRWGTVRLEEMKGPAFILYWSWDVNGNFLHFLNPLNWVRAEKRWDRVFQRVRCEPATAVER